MIRIKLIIPIISIYLSVWLSAQTPGLLERYCQATYFRCEAEDSISQYRFKIHQGDIVNLDGDSCVCWKGNGYMLDSLILPQLSRSSLLDLSEIRYFSYLKIRMDKEERNDSTAIIGVFEILNISTNSLVLCDTLIAKNIKVDNNVYHLCNRLENSDVDSYVLRDDYIETTQRVLFRFKTFGNCSVYIDNLTVYCQHGYEIIEDQLLDHEIFYYLLRSDFENHNLRWGFRTGLLPGNYMIYDHLDSLMYSAIEYYDYIQMSRFPDNGKRHINE